MVEKAVAATSDMPSEAPGSHKQFAELAWVSDQAELPDSMEIVRRLLWDRETLLERPEKPSTPPRSTTMPSADLLSQRMQVHQKAAWMPRATLGQRCRLPPIIDRQPRRSP
jgi:starvation-inducible DNA-binding protein